MPIEVRHGYFEKDEEAYRELEGTGLFVGKEEARATSEGTPLHWHEIDIHVYITEGTFRFQDPSTGTVYECGPGTKFHIPLARSTSRSPTTATRPSMACPSPSRTSTRASSVRPKNSTRSALGTVRS